jgi:hypothetical protein
MRRLWLVGILALAACAHGPVIVTPAPMDQAGVHVVVEGAYFTGGDYFTAGTLSGLYGTATNVTARDMTSVFINFDLLDGQGAKIGTAITSTTDLDAGRTWKFQALIESGYAAATRRIRITSVQAYWKQ